MVLAGLTVKENDGPPRFARYMPLPAARSRRTAPLPPRAVSGGGPGWRLRLSTRPLAGV